MSLAAYVHRYSNYEFDIFQLVFTITSSEMYPVYLRMLICIIKSKFAVREGEEQDISGCNGVPFAV